MQESSEVEGREAAAAIKSTYASVVRSPEEDGGGGATPEDDSTLGCLELALI